MKEFYSSVRHLLVVLLFFVFVSGFSQSILGLHSDNYAGVYSLDYNPAEIVDSRYKVHINLISGNFDLSNNYLSIKRGGIRRMLKGLEFSDYINKTPGYDRELYSSGEVSILPSFIFSFGGDDDSVAQSVGFSYKSRYQGSVSGLYLNEKATEGLFSESGYGLGTRGEYIDHPKLQLNFWNEYAFTYGRTIKDSGKDYITVAATLKLTQGYAPASLRGNSGVYVGSNNNNDDLNIRGGNIELRYSLPFEKGLGFSTLTDSYSSGDIGFGTDIGAVWEYRPDVANDTISGGGSFTDHTVEKYKLKVGLSVMDLGFVPYSMYEGHKYDINSDFYESDLESVYTGLSNNLSLSNVEKVLSSRSSSEFDIKESKMTISLPTRINAYVDYSIKSHFYANFATTIAPRIYLFSEPVNSVIWSATLTPRYERKHFSMYMPITYNSHVRFMTGFGFRVGPLVLGSNDILGLTGITNPSGANVYLGLSIPIRKKINDRDGDGVFDKDDVCPDKSGTIELKGCPDADEDGVPDHSDECPDEPGSKKTKGCPDADEDGVPDHSDECPDEPGTIELKGCPDADEDGIPDVDDLCPDVAGDQENHGCPEDSGKQESAEDTTLDDESPVLESPEENKEIEVQKDELLKKLDNFGFDTGSVSVDEESYHLIDEISSLLRDNPDYIIYIDGHTDSVGSAQSNMDLSRARLNYLRSALIIRGVEAKNIVVKAYGESKPIASNATAEGRKKNRRVDFRLDKRR